MSQFNYIIYETTTGKIISYMTVYNESDILLQDLTGKSYKQVEAFDTGDMKTHYIKNDEVVKRPSQSTAFSKTTIVANGVDTIHITNAPNGAKLIAYCDTTNELIEATIESNDTFVTNVVGSIKIEIIKPPYLDFGVTINAS
jgi:hypothetical protein